MKMKLIALVAFVSVAGTASAGVIADQDFDGGATGTGTWSYDAGLDTTGDATTTTAGRQDGTATLNSTIDYGFDNSGSTVAGAGTLWISYRLTMPAHSQWSGNSIEQAGFLRSGESSSSDMIGFKANPNAGGQWGDYHYYINIGGAAYEDTSGDVFTYDQNADLFVFGKFSYETNGNRSFSIASVDWADRATATEADLASGFSASWVDPHTGEFSGNTDRFIDSLSFTLNQPDAAVSVTMDDIIVGDTFDDIAGIAPTEAPSAPTNLVATAIAHSQINLTWDDTSIVEDGFYIERGLSAGSYSVIATNAGSTFSDTSVSELTEYFYRVSAFNNIGISTGNPTASATTPIQPAGPPTGWDIADYTQHLLTFDADVAGVFRANVGNEVVYNIVEPNGYGRSLSNTDGGNALFSEAVAASQQWTNGDGTGNGSATRFLADGNQNGNTSDQNIGYVQIGTKLGSGATGNHAYQLGGNITGDGTSTNNTPANDHAVNGLYIRIRNNTGGTVVNWTFDANIYFGESDANNFSTLQYSYAIDNSVDPNGMTFTPFGTAPVVQQGDAITNLAGTLNFTVTTTGVADGGYIVLAFRDTPSAAGSDIYIDDIGVTAVNAGGQYGIWASLYGLTEGPDGHDDDDGMPNFYEYALNGDPTNSADIGIVEYSQDGSFFTYIHGKRLDDPSLVYTLEDTEDLVTGPFHTDAWDSQTSGAAGEAGFDAVTNKYDMTGKSEQFIHLIIE